MVNVTLASAPVSARPLAPTFTTTAQHAVESDLVYRLGLTTVQARAAIDLVKSIGEFQLGANVLTFADGRYTVKPV